MRVGVISDTHGNLAGLLEVYDRLRADSGIVKIFFLGHHYGDIDRLIGIKEALQKAKSKRRAHDDDTIDGGLLAGALLSEALAGSKPAPRVPPARDKLEDTAWIRKHLVRIAAADDDEALQGRAAKSDFEMVAGRFICAVHDPRQLQKDDIASASIVLYGHTHIAQADKMSGRYFLNPGHLMERDDQGRAPSYGVLDLGDSPSFRVHDLDGVIRQEFPLDLEIKRKFSVS